MASYTPPTETLPIFDNAVFEQQGSALTIAKANLLYLRKNFADTCTALETFNAGIAVNTIQPTSTATTMLINSTMTTGDLYIGSNTLGTNLRTGTIHIGDSNNIASGGSVLINNGTSNTSTTSVMNGYITSGNLNLMSGPNCTGTINMGNGNSNVTTVNILTGQNCTGQFNIGTATVGSNTIPVNINTGNQTGTVTIGNSSNIVQVNGAVTLAKPLILGSVPTLNTQLGFIINSNLTASVVLATNSSVAQPITSFTLPIGVWQCSYQIRYYNPTGTTTMTSQTAYMLLTTRQTNYGLIFGWDGNYGVNWTINTSGIYTAHASATIYTSVSNTLTLYTDSIYTGTAALNCYSDAVGNIQTYLMAVRIA